MKTKKPSTAPAATSKGSSKLVRTIIGDLEEGLASLKAGAPLRTRSVWAPEPLDIAELRKRHGLSQSEFASKFGFNVRTLQEWEHGRATPDTAVRFYLQVIDKNPRAVEKAIGTVTRSR